MWIESNTQNLFKASFSWLKENVPMFEIYKRGERSSSIKSVKWIKWNFMWISTKEFTYMKNWKEKIWVNVNINIVDWDKTCIIQSSWNSIIRTALNSLLSVKKWEKVSIVVYPWKNDFPWIAVRTGNELEELAKRKISWDEQKTLITSQMIKWEKVNDFSLLEEKLIKESIKYVYEKPEEHDVDWDFSDIIDEGILKINTKDDDLPF
jgi:hypothetical protein